MEAPLSQHHTPPSGTPQTASTMRVPLDERLAAGLRFVAYGLVLSGFLASFSPFERRLNGIIGGAQSAFSLLTDSFRSGTLPKYDVKPSMVTSIFGMQCILELLIWLLVASAFLRLCGFQSLLPHRLFWWCAMTHAGAYILVVSLLLVTAYQYFPWFGDPYDVVSPFKIAFPLFAVSLIMVYRTRRTASLESSP